MIDSFLVFVAVDIGCFLLLALLFSVVSGKDDMSFERALYSIWFHFV